MKKLKLALFELLLHHNLLPRSLWYSCRQMQLERLASLNPSSVVRVTLSNGKMEWHYRFCRCKICLPVREAEKAKKYQERRERAIAIIMEGPGITKEEFEARKGLIISSIEYWKKS